MASPLVPPGIQVIQAWITEDLAVQATLTCKPEPGKAHNVPQSVAGGSNYHKLHQAKLMAADVIKKIASLLLF